ncbi:MAG: FHA domain-containing protein [Chloroflexota bacterium]
MITCNNCKHVNPAGSVFCDECGAQLAESNLITQSIRTDQVREALGSSDATPLPSRSASAIAADSWGSLHLLDSGQILPLANRNEFTIGRVSEGQPVMPDVDLSPYQAYAGGVSRLHASIRRDGRRIVIMDLGSANGTYVNGKRLTPNTERLVNHGDVIALGKLKFQILIK